MGRCKDVRVPTERRYVLTLTCPDTTGIVARIAGFLAEAGAGSSRRATTPTDSGWFFTRQVVRADSLPFDIDELRGGSRDVAAELGARGVVDGDRHRRAQAGGAAGQQGDALPARPAGPGRRR